MKLLAVDPSSTCMGYALMTGPADLIECGLLKPNRTRDEANVRIETMVADAVQLVYRERPDRIVIEDTSGKVGTRGRARGMNGAGLAVHGKAVGWLVGRLKAAGGVPVSLVVENEWTRGVKKEHRQQIVAREYRTYDAAKDPGGDASDAIGLGRWFFVTQASPAVDDAAAGAFPSAPAAAAEGAR